MCHINVFTSLRTFRVTNIWSPFHATVELPLCPALKVVYWLYSIVRCYTLRPWRSGKCICYGDAFSICDWVESGILLIAVVLVRGLLRLTTTALRSDRWLADVKVSVWWALTIAAVILKLVRRDVRVGSTALRSRKSSEVALLIRCQKFGGASGLGSHGCFTLCGLFCQQMLILSIMALAIALCLLFLLLQNQMITPSFFYPSPTNNDCKQ